MTGWHVHEVQGVIFVMGADDISVCQISRSSGVGTARLIAAAPIMLEMLGGLQTGLEFMAEGEIPGRRALEKTIAEIKQIAKMVTEAPDDPA